jgi:hypothetical protein
VAGICTIISEILVFPGSRSLFKDKRINISLRSLTRLKHSFVYKDVARPKWYKYSGFQIEKDSTQDVSAGGCSNNRILSVVADSERWRINYRNTSRVTGNERS